MPQLFSIEKFSSALCLVHATDQGLNETPSIYFEVTEHSSCVYGVIDELNEIFQLEFQPILDKMTNDETLGSFNSFMKATLSRFIKMSATPTYFHFMLLSSLAETVAFYTFNDTQCYTFAKLTLLCLGVVYQKCYKHLFEENEHYESLGWYCKRIYPYLLSEQGKSQFSTYQEDIRTLLRSLLYVDYDRFTLTDSEERMLFDILDRVLLEETPQDPVASKDDSWESDFATAKSCIEKMTRLHLDEYSSRLRQICGYCGGKCIKFLSPYRRPKVSN